MVLYLASIGHPGMDWLHHALREYVAFITLLGALFVISGGIYLRGSLSGTPLVNTAFLGDRRAARQLRRHHRRVDAAHPAAAARQRERGSARSTSSCSSSSSCRTARGMLTPLGDPPLFLGFLRGVPFLWTFRLVGRLGAGQRRAAGAVQRPRQRRARARGARAAGLAARRRDGGRRAAPHRRRASTSCGWPA